MRNFDSRKTFLFVIIILTLINLGFVVSVIVMQRNNDEEKPLMKPFRQPVHFMAGEVGFTEAQMQAFRSYRLEYRDASAPLHERLRELNHELVTEAMSENPDTMLCNQISAEIGTTHRELKRLTARHIMQVRDIATPEQMEKLHGFYEEVFDGPRPGRGEGRQFRHRRGRIQ